MKKAIFYFLVNIIVLLSNFVFGAIPAEERAALIALYNSTNGDSWYHNNGWKEPPLHTDGFAMPGTEESWRGVYSIDYSKDHIYHLELLSNNLSGSIPPQLGNLSKLIYLHIGYNQLSGSIPPQLGNLSNLKYLCIYETKLSGSIPPQLGNLSNLVDIFLDNNQLSGSIPPELGNLSNLKRLILHYNQLSGSIPSQLGNLSNLSELYLNDNQLNGSIPPQFGNLSNLECLYLQNNQLCDSIPPQLGNLSILSELNLNNNQLSGSIPYQLGNLGQLFYLDMSNNQLSGSIPPQFGNLSNLVELYLNNNQLSGSIPYQLGKLNLVLLYLNNNQLSGVIPSSFTTNSYLSYLDVGYNCLYATDPAIRALLDSLDPDWEAHQDQCSTTSLSGRIRIKNSNSEPWMIDNVQLDSYVSIPDLGTTMKIKADGTYSSSGISIAPGTYTITAELNYNDYITVDNMNTPPPSGNKIKRTAKSTAANFKIEPGSNTLNFDYQLPVFLIHGIRDAYTTWDQWSEYLTKNGYIVFTPNHEFVFISKEAEAR